MYSPSFPSQWAACGDNVARSNPSGVGTAKAKNAGRGWRGSPGHQPTSICWASAELRTMKSSEGGSEGRPENRLTARSNDPHQALTGVERPRYGARKGGEYQSRLCRYREVGTDLVGIIGGVFVIRIEGHGPRCLLGARIDLHGTDEVANRSEHGSGHLPDRTVRRERNAPDPSIAMFDQRLMATQIERHHQGTGSIRSWQWPRLPAASGEPECCVLELRLRGSQGHGKLSEHLGMCMQGVAGCGPGFIGERRPCRRHWNNRNRRIEPSLPVSL